MSKAEFEVKRVPSGGIKVIVEKDQSGLGVDFSTLDFYGPVNFRKILEVVASNVFGIHSIDPPFLLAANGLFEWINGINFGIWSGSPHNVSGMSSIDPIFNNRSRLKRFDGQEKGI